MSIFIYIDNGDKRLPNITLDDTTGVLEFEGRSIPEKTDEFYAPVIAWLEKYAQNPCAETVVNFKMVYFNSSSKKYLRRILTYFDDLIKKGSKVQVNWYHEDDDEDIMEMGENYKEQFIDLPINLISVPCDD